MTEEIQKEKISLDQHVIDLVNRGVDGDLNDREQQQLDQLKAESETVNALYKELVAVTRILNNTPELEPPEHLQATIERQVRLPVPGGHTSNKTHWIESILSAPWLRTGFAMTAVAVIALGVYHMGSAPLSTQDGPNMSGTIARPSTDKSAPVLDRFDLQADLMHGQVEISGDTDMLTMQIHLDTKLPSELLIDFGKPGLNFLSLHQQQERKDSYSVKNNIIQISGSGEQDYTLKFDRLGDSDSDLPMQIDFFANNLLVQSALLSVKHN